MARRSCSKCGKSYYRRHMAVMWVISRSGDKFIWRPIKVVVGAEHPGCMNQRQVRQIAQVGQFALTGQEAALLSAPVIDITKLQEKKRA